MRRAAVGRLCVCWCVLARVGVCWCVCGGGGGVGGLRFRADCCRLAPSKRRINGSSNRGRQHRSTRARAWRRTRQPRLLLDLGVGHQRVAVDVGGAPDLVEGADLRGARGVFELPRLGERHPQPAVAALSAAAATAAAAAAAGGARLAAARAAAVLRAGRAAGAGANGSAGLQRRLERAGRRERGRRQRRRLATLPDAADAAQ